MQANCTKFATNTIQLMIKEEGGRGLKTGLDENHEFENIQIWQDQCKDMKKERNFVLDLVTSIFQRSTANQRNDIYTNASWLEFFTGMVK